MKLSSKQPTCSQLRAGDEHAVALPDAVEPVAVTDEVPDLEEPVPGVRPSDLGQEAVLVVLVVAVAIAIALLTGSEVPLLGGDDGRRVGGQPSHPEVEHARREDVCAVDHQRERSTAPRSDPAVERHDR